MFNSTATISIHLRGDDPHRTSFSIDSTKGSISVKIRSGPRDLEGPRAPTPMPHGSAQFVQDAPVAHRSLNGRQNGSQRPNCPQNGFHPHATPRAMYRGPIMPLGRSTGLPGTTGRRHPDQISPPPSNPQLRDSDFIGGHPALDRHAFAPVNAPIADATDCLPVQPNSNPDSDDDEDTPYLLEKQKALRDLILSLPEKYRLASVDLDWNDGPIRAAAHVIGMLKAELKSLKELKANEARGA